MSQIHLRFSILTIAHIGGAVFGLISTMIIVRTLGPGGFGFIVLGLSIQNYAIVFANLGTDLYSVQVTAKNPETFRHNVAVSIYIRLLVGIPVFFFILLICALGVWQGEARQVVLLFSLSVFINAFSPLWAPQALERVGVVAFFSIAGQGLNLVLILLAVGMDTGLLGFVAARLGADIIVAAGLITWIRRTAGGLDWGLPFRELRRIARQTTPIAASQVLRSLGIGNDIIILSLFVSTESVGLYAGAFRIFTLALSVATLYFVILLPILSRRVNDGIAALSKEFSASNQRFWPLVAAGAVVGSLLANFGLTLLFGAEFSAVTGVLQILFLALFLNVVQRSYRQVLLAVGARRSELRCTLIGTAINIGSKLILIPMIGITGAAIGTVLGEATLLLLQRRAAQKELTVENTS